MNEYFYYSCVIKIYTMKKLTIILFVIILMTSCKSNKSDITSSQFETEEIYVFKNTSEFLDSIKINGDKYLNKKIEITDGYCSLLEDESDTSYRLLVTNNLGSSNVILHDIKKDIDTSKFKESISFYNSSRVIDTKNGKEIEDVDGYMYDGEDGHVHDIFGDISRVLRYEEYNEEYNKEDIPTILKKIINTSRYKNFIEDMKVGRYIVITSSQYDSLYDVYKTETVPMTKISFTGTYIGYRETNTKSVGIVDQKTGNGYIVGYNHFTNISINKIEILDTPKIYTTPNKSIDFSSYLNQITTPN